MIVPSINDEYRLKRLVPPDERINMVLDTDTFNEVDDQFAIVYALKSSEKLDVKAIYAAPFLNKRSSSPADGMEKSYNEIVKLLKLLDTSANQFVYKGSAGFLQDYNNPYRSEAALDLVDRAMKSEQRPLYVVAIGAITNVASAILIEPKIIERIVVVWLGGHSHFWPDTKEFNLRQDLLGSRLLLDCGVPLVQIPCLGAASHLLTTIYELEACIKGKSAVGDYLCQLVRNYSEDHTGWAKVIWDISTIAWLINSEWIPTSIVHSPVLTDQITWSVDRSRHLIRAAYFAYRNPIFKDLFKKIAGY